MDRRVGIRVIVRPDSKQSNLVLLRIQRLITELPGSIYGIAVILVRLRSVGHVLDVFGCGASEVSLH